MLWLVIFIFGFLFNNRLEANHEKKLSSAVVVGTVYCDTCFGQDFSKTSYFISGASVAVECGDGSSKPSFHKEVKTNKHGEFKVHLPFAVSKHVKRIKRCFAKLINSNGPFCALASRATSSSLHLKSRKQGIHIVSDGVFTFKPRKQLELCNKKPSLATSKDISPKKLSLPSLDLQIFPPITQDPTTPNLPPLPPVSPLPPETQNPALPNLPPLPRQPNLPPFPKKPVDRDITAISKATPLLDKKIDHSTFFSPTPISFSPSLPLAFGMPLPSNPFQPSQPIINGPPRPVLSPLPPALGIPLPPNPFQQPVQTPSPTALGGPLPPNPFQLPPAIINSPPIPVPTPPLSPTGFPLPLPRFPVPYPFLLSPPFPGIPPASSKKASP